MDKSSWVDLGMQAVIEMIDDLDAVVAKEIEARGSERVWGSLERLIEPHIFTDAKRELLRQGVIGVTISPTRGRRTVSVYHAADLRRRKTAFTKAAGRKRLLQGRYEGWATGPKGQRGLMGPAGERVAVASLNRAAPYVGYRVENPAAGPVTHLFGAKVPVGPLDAAARFIGEDDPPTWLHLLIEVKNVREWIYPTNRLLFQLLDKGAQLQLAFPARRFLPVLICRRAWRKTFWMAHDLGFHVIAARQQFLLPLASLNDRHLQEVRSELSYLDLHPSEEPADLLVNQFRDTIPRRGPDAAERWARYAPILELFSEARRTPGQRGRSSVVDKIRRQGEQAAHTFDDEWWGDW